MEPVHKRPRCSGEPTLVYLKLEAASRLSQRGHARGRGHPDLGAQQKAQRMEVYRQRGAYPQDQNIRVVLVSGSLQTRNCKSQIRVLLASSVFKV